MGYNNKCYQQIIPDFHYGHVKKKKKNGKLTALLLSLHIPSSLNLFGVFLTTIQCYSKLREKTVTLAEFLKEHNEKQEKKYLCVLLHSSPALCCPAGLNFANPDSISFIPPTKPHMNVYFKPFLHLSATTFLSTKSKPYMTSNIFSKQTHI